MSQDIINHSLVIGSRQDVMRAFTQLLKDGYREILLDTAKEAIIMLAQRVDSIVEAGVDNAGESLRRAYDNGFISPYDAGFFPQVRNNAGQMTETEARELAEAFEVVVLPEGRSVDMTATREAMDALASNPDHHKAVAEVLETKKAPVDHRSPNDGVLAGVPPVAACAFAEAFDFEFARKALSSLTKTFFRRCLGGSQDGKRVSREVHEYNYCKSSEQLDLAVLLCANFLNNGGAAGQAIAGDFDNVVLTYGNFVDWSRGRGLIAQIRKVDRLLRSANVKEILQLTNTDKATLRQNLLDEISVDTAAGQLADVLGF